MVAKTLLVNSIVSCGTVGVRQTKRLFEAKAKLSFYANIYVVQDKANPQNEGKVFCYKFGKKILTRLWKQCNQSLRMKLLSIPFDFWQGANFKLKIVKKVAGYWNYDSSEFDRPSPLLDDDDALEGIWKQQHSLTAFTADDQFKSYDDLKKRLIMFWALSLSVYC